MTCNGDIYCGEFHPVEQTKRTYTRKYNYTPDGKCADGGCGCE